MEEHISVELSHAVLCNMLLVFFRDQRPFRPRLSWLDPKTRNIDELDGPLGLDGCHSSIHILGHHSPLYIKQQAMHFPW
ncbi:hypothetical protein CCACVL1_10720 [Corchorus capsularis]|uniref:Uncharacterized protein n=1 Tax=Corchorus capsularis TaxID=210143 RepID=A0A1R3IQ34_COCAP|nr:hypothetical protein CCACVL1_10720 [Corchorus capsularis]